MRMYTEPLTLVHDAHSWWAMLHDEVDETQVPGQAVEL